MEFLQNNLVFYGAIAVLAAVFFLPQLISVGKSILDDLDLLPAKATGIVKPAVAVGDDSADFAAYSMLCRRAEKLGAAGAVAPLEALLPILFGPVVKADKYSDTLPARSAS